MWHLGKKSSPDALIKLGIRDAPSDSSQSFAMVLAVAHCQTVSASACVSNQSISYNWSKAGQATMLPTKGILCRVSQRGVQRQAARYASTRNLLLSRDSGRVRCSRKWMIYRKRLAPETLPCAIQNVFMVLKWRHIGSCGTRWHLRGPIVWLLKCTICPSKLRRLSLLEGNWITCKSVSCTVHSLLHFLLIWSNNFIISF